MKSLSELCPGCFSDLTGLAEAGHLCHMTKVADDLHPPKTLEKRGLELLCLLGLRNMPSHC